MGAKYLFWCTFLIVQVLCEQKKSLTFVIDNSISMEDDIAYVRNATKSIMDIVLHEKSSQIEDIVVVTFNDPSWEFHKRTRNEVELRKSLDTIKLVGNTDCPEMSLSGIKLGLEESLAGSFLYVFTDASAKDYKMYADIKELCQKKQIQIVFVLTGDCKKYDNSIVASEKSHVYDKIAAASNGQVFRVSKEEVGQVLENVRETIKGDKTVLVSKVVTSNPDRDSFVYFDIDDKTEYALVSASGTDVKLTIRKKGGIDIPGTHVTWTANVKVLKLTGITPGAYRAAVRGSSNVNVMVFGRTDFNFEFGFSDKMGSSLKYTETQPVIGTETHLIISVKDDEHSVNIQNVQIVDMNEKVLQVLPLTNVEGNVYRTAKFLPPNTMFKVAVTATARNTGKTITRIANTPAEPIKPVVEAPEITDSEKNATAKEGSTVNIHCRIRKGKPKPEVTWYYQQQGATDFKLMKGETDDVLRVRNVAASDAGQYRCVAENTAGRAAHVIQLEVEALPTIIKTQSVVKTKQSSNVTIQCKISKGYPSPIVKWQFKDTERAQFHDIDNTGEQLSIVNAQLGYSGFYKCLATNTVGTAEQVTEVIVLVPPKIEKENVHITRTEGSDVSLSCGKVAGSPPPTITWLFRPLGSRTAQPLTAAAGSNEVNINSVTLKDSGFYTCRVDNEAGFDEHAMEVTIEAAPQLQSFPKIVTAKEKSLVRIDCKIPKGSPPPEITWFFKAANADSYESLIVDAATLELTDVRAHNSGHYKCEAKNNAGRVEQDVELVVEVLPAFVKTATVVKTRQLSNVEIQCKISKGNPFPTVKWQFKNTERGDFHDIDNTGEQLSIVNAQLRNSGFYKCQATNTVGTAEQVTEVIVSVPPQMEKESVRITRFEGSGVLLSCGKFVGSPNPPPTITWLFKQLGSNTTKLLKTVPDAYKINKKTLRAQDSGLYTCRVENEAGFDEHTIEVTVEAIEAAPQLESFPKYVTAKENSLVRIGCKVSKGFPKPTVTWWYKGATSTDYVSIANNKEYLRLDNIQMDNAGQYKCVARNSVGQAEQDVQVIVEAPARIVFIPPNRPSYIGVVGDVVMRLSCPAVGYPKPTVSWTVDHVVVGNDKSETLYVEDGVLYLKKPEETHSSNYFHTYVCHALNEFGKDEQSYEVVVSMYAEYDERDDKYAEVKKPFDLNCALPYTDLNSVRWYYNSFYMNKTGPSLHFDEPTQANNGNYTCRVSDLRGAASDTVELTFGLPPSASPLSFDEEWNGEENELTCKTEQIPGGKYEWYYRGEKINEAEAQELSVDLIGWGQYVCRVTNPLGSVNITYNVYTDDCIIDRSLSKTKNLPLVLDMSSTWPSFSRRRQYQIIPQAEQFTLICQDESPISTKETKSSSNSFTKFPNTKSIIATCDHEDVFLVNGVPHKFSELDCKEGVSTSVVKTKECWGSNTMMMNVGFNVNGFLDVYNSCLDTKRNVVLYTEVMTTGADTSGYTNTGEGSCQSVGDCCYESVQLVNAADVGAGPAEKATLREPLNSVSYCRPNDVHATNWHDIENQVRQVSFQSSMIVWSGAANYTTVGKLLVPQYLWKVVKDLDSEEIVAIVHSNEQTPSARLCEDVCHVSSWFNDPHGARTYCCKLDEFKRLFDCPPTLIASFTSGGWRSAARLPMSTSR